MEKPDKNATGTSNAIPVSDIFALSDKLTPDVKTYGFIYCTSEDNSVNTIKNAKEYCDSNNIKYEEVSVTSSSDVEQAIKSLTDKGVEEIPAVVVPASKTVVNKTTAEAIGVTISDNAEITYVEDAK